MRTIEGSSRGGRGYRGGGRGRGVGASGGGRRGGEDKRFAARLTDPRFTSTSSRGGRGGRGGGYSSQRMSHASPRDAAMLSDPRFAKYAAPQEDEEEPEEEEGEEEEEEGSLVDSQDEGVASDGSEAIDEEALAILDQDAAAWSGSEVDFCEATQRFAIVNCDWDHIRAVDLYAILFHSLPLGGQLRHVKVYLSEFGKKMLAHEKMHGPDLWVKPGEADEAVDGGEEVIMEPLDDDEDQVDDEDADGRDDNDDGWVEDDPAMVGEVGEDGEKFSGGKHRKYERDRMKYYYAVATFDSSETAAAVYGDLDGMDIEGSGVVLDLRYVDDEETFTEPPADSCSALPPKFKPLGSFKAAALTQTQFRISWDQDDVHRHQSVRDSFTGTTEEDDLMAYIAQDSSDEDDENEPIYELRKKRREAKRAAIRKKYASLLAEIGGIPDELPEEKNNDGDQNSNDGNSNQSDDDDLNRFSDLDSDSDDDRGVAGNFESTIDFDADTKAQQLQRDLVKSRQMEAADIGTKSQLKYKTQRKENKAAKREMIEETRKAERAEIEAQRLAHRQSLQDSMGDMVEQEREKKSGKEKRKDHAKKKKEDAAKTREEKKKLRIAGALGVSTAAVSKKNADGNDTAAAIDSRFAGKLVSDPRFHLDVAQKDKRANQDVVKLASTVIKARQQKDLRPSSSAPKKQALDDTAVEYFLSRPQKKARKE